MSADADDVPLRRGLPGEPCGAWDMHGVFHKKLKKQRKQNEDGGVMQQDLCEIAGRAARIAEQSGDVYDELIGAGARYFSKEDWRRAGKAYREAIALRPQAPDAYYDLGAVLVNLGHYVEAAQRFLEATVRYPEGSEEGWAQATARAFDTVMLTEKRVQRGGQKCTRPE